jgi:hypothetical protein
MLKAVLPTASDLRPPLRAPFPGVPAPALAAASTVQREAGAGEIGGCRGESACRC